MSLWRLERVPEPEAMDAADEVARPIHRLAEMLFGGAAVQLPQKHESEHVMQFGPLKIRTR